MSLDCGRKNEPTDLLLARHANDPFVATGEHLAMHYIIVLYGVVIWVYELANFFIQVRYTAHEIFCDVDSA